MREYNRNLTENRHYNITKAFFDKKERGLTSAK